MLTDVPENSFTPTPPPGETTDVSPSTAPRRRASLAKKTAVKKAKKEKAPKVPKNLHAVTDVEIKAGAAKKRAKKVKAKKTERAPAETVKISLKELATLKYGPLAAPVFLKMHKQLAACSRPQRDAVMRALKETFA